MLRTARPRQWTKNVLVFAVPAAAGRLGDGDVLVASALAFLAFVLASSGTYLINDAADAEADRLHPIKRYRPVAAGELSPRTAVIAGVLALLAAFAVALAASPLLLAVVAGYVLLTSLYTRWLKHVAVFDIATIAAGFFLRAVSGGIAADIFVSRWFLIVAGGGSLFLIVGKRYAELVAAPEEAVARRPALRLYTREYLESMLSTTAGVTVVAYCLWSFETRAADTASGWAEVSAVPFVLGVMRYGLLLSQGHGEEPEEVLLGDRVLLAIGVAWLAALALGKLA